MILKVDGIEFSYNSHPVLNDINFEVNRGEFLSILGNNGAGKTTLLKCINRILRAKKGTVFLEKEDISKLSRSEIAQKIGYVAQKQEGSGFTVFDMVLLGRKPYIKWDVSEKDIEIVREVLEMLKLEHLALKYLDELSGGELQKVFIARAIAQEPQVLLLDEPTNNLDLKNQIEVMRIIRESVKKNNISSIVVIHDINLALRFSDKFLLLKDNTIFAYGDINIITPENISSVYGVPVTIERIKDIPVVIPMD
ncbi:MAG: ABC transporter ATP-binding protein [bacterium]